MRMLAAGMVTVLGAAISMPASAASGGERSSAHVAISIGDGRTVESRKKLPGKRTPPTVTLKRGKTQ